MMRLFLTTAFIALLSASASAEVARAEAEAALASAQAAENDAFAAKAAWTTTEALLKDAQKALAAGKFDEAKTAADEALALAKRSVEQANEQKSLWRNAVMR